MMPPQLVWLDAAKGLMTQPLRSLISLLAVATTVFALLLMFNLNFAAKRQMEETLKQVGNTFHAWVFTPPAQQNTIPYHSLHKLTNNQSLRVLPYVPFVKEGLNQEKISVVATQHDMIEFLKLDIEQGIGLFNHNNQHSAVIGHQVAKEYQLKPFDLIWVASQGYQVLNVLAKAPTNPIYNMNPNNTVFIDLHEMAHEVEHIEDYLIEFPDTMTKAQAKASFEAQIKHHFGEFMVQYRDEDFMTHSIKQSLQGIEKIMNTIAKIAIGLGLVGILSQQWMSFWHRRGECGMRLCLGAQKSQLVWLFITESLILSLAGAGLGFMIGAFGLKALLNHLGWSFFMAWGTSGWIVMGCMLICLISATIPAMIAANSRPMGLLAHQ